MSDFESNGHEWMEITLVEDFKRRYICLICGQIQFGERLPDVCPETSVKKEE